MKTKTLLAALVMVAAPAVAMAECSGGKHDTAAMSCTEGTTWDPQAQTCVPVASS
jgi:hypothetical protein